MKYRFLGAAALAGLFGLAVQGALAQDEPAAETTEPAAAGEATAAGEAAAAADAGDPVVAIVDGKELRRSDVVASARSLPEQYQQQIDALFPALIERLVDLTLLGAEAEKQGLASDAEVETRVALYREQAMREVMIDRFLRDAVSEDKIKARYDEMVAGMPAQEEVRARHILVDSEDKAKEIIAKLDDGGSFEDLAKENSTDGAAQDGGDLGYFTKDQMVPEFAEAAFAMEKGTHSAAPVQTQFGWHVIKVEDRRPMAPPPLEEVRASLQEDLSRTAIAEWVSSLRAAAKVERFNPDGSPIVEAPAEEDPEAAPEEAEGGEEGGDAEDAAE